MDSNKFKETLDLIKDANKKYADRIPELGKSVIEKLTACLEKERDCYTQLCEIFEMEGETTSELHFADGGRYVKITEKLGGDPGGETMSRNGFELRYKNIHDANFDGDRCCTIRKICEHPTFNADIFGGAVDTPLKLENAYNMLTQSMRYIDLADKVIEAYISWRNSIENNRSKMIKSLIPSKDDEESYW